MSKIAIIYGSQTGKAEAVAERIKQKLGDNVDVYDANYFSADKVADYTHFIFGTSTTGVGEMQPELEHLLPDLVPGLSGKTVAIFALGDSKGYPESFAGSMSYIYDEVADSGCNLVGAWPNEGYLEHDSPGIVDGKFVGLALDEVTEADKTEQRISDWLKLIAFDA